MCVAGMKQTPPAKVLDCGLKVSEFELQSCHYVYLWNKTLRKGMTPLIAPLYHFCSTRIALAKKPKGRLKSSYDDAVSTVDELLSIIWS